MTIRRTASTPRTRVVADPGSLGIVIGGSGNGEQIAANKVTGVRAALAYNLETATLARQHNDANVLGLGARMHEHGRGDLDRGRLRGHAVLAGAAPSAPDRPGDRVRADRQSAGWTAARRRLSPAGGCHCRRTMASSRSAAARSAALRPGHVAGPQRAADAELGRRVAGQIAPAPLRPAGRGGSPRLPGAVRRPVGAAAVGAGVSGRRLIRPRPVRMLAPSASGAGRSVRGGRRRRHLRLLSGLASHRATCMPEIEPSILAQL